MAAGPVYWLPAAPVVLGPVGVPPNPLTIAGPKPSVLDPTTTLVAAVPRVIGVPDTVTTEGAAGAGAMDVVVGCGAGTLG